MASIKNLRINGIDYNIDAGVSVNQILTSGTESCNITIDGNTTTIYSTEDTKNTVGSTYD